jgi:hypothetical protein
MRNLIVLAEQGIGASSVRASSSAALMRAKAWCQSVGSLVMYRPLSLSVHALMKSYHTGYKFCVGSRNEAHVPEFLSRPLRPRGLPSWNWTCRRSLRDKCDR